MLGKFRHTQGLLFREKLCSSRPLDPFLKIAYSQSAYQHDEPWHTKPLALLLGALWIMPQNLESRQQCIFPACLAPAHKKDVANTPHQGYKISA